MNHGGENIGEQPVCKNYPKEYSDDSLEVTKKPRKKLAAGLRRLS